MNRRVLRADIALLAAAMIWGGGFVAQRVGMRDVGPMTFSAIRFVLGTAVVALMMAVRPRPALSEWPWRSGLAAGALLFAGVALQQIGMVTVEAGRAGFITGLYVIFTPLLAALWGQRTSAGTWLASCLALSGMYLLGGPTGTEFSTGDLYVVGCAVVWAAHVLLLGRFAPLTDPLRLAAVQFGVVAILATVATLVFESPRLVDLQAAAPSLAYGGLVSVGLAFTLQVVAQRHAPAPHAAVLLSMESVFAAGAGALWLGERLGSRELLGCAALFAAMLVSQLWSPSAQDEPQSTPVPDPAENS